MLAVVFLTNSIKKKILICCMLLASLDASQCTAI